MTTREFELWHPTGLLVSSRLTEAELISNLPQVSDSRQHKHTGWVWYRLPAYEDHDVVVRIALGFNRGVLEKVTLSDGHSKYGGDWKDWSQEKECSRAASLGTWLSDLGYPAGSYAWGRIWVGYDEKAGTGGARIRFAT